MQAQRLLDRALEHGDLAQRLVARRRGRRRRARRARRRTRASALGMAQQLDQRPRRRCVEVVWCPANIIEMNMPVIVVGAEARRPSALLMREQHVEEVAALAGPRGCAALEDRLEQRDQAPRARGRACGRPRCGRCGFDVGEGVGALLEVVEERGELGGRAPRGTRLPIRHGARRVDGELGEPVEQVELAPSPRAARPCGRSRRRSSRRGPA